MRLAILDSGHSFGTKALFAFIRAVSRQPVPEVVKLVKYRPDFFGTPMQRVVQEAMRGRAEAQEVYRDGSAPGRRQVWNEVVIDVRVVRKPMQQREGWPAARKVAGV